MVRVDTTGYRSSQKDTLGEFQAYDLMHVSGNALAFWFCGCSFRKKIVSGAAGAAAAACVLAR